jgi:DNA-dependent RNA polymerase auxiliary subunit epsilon
MIEIPLSQGFVALIDDEDYELVSKYKWHITTGKRAIYVTASTWVNKKQVNIIMHRLIMNCPKGMEVDHINHEGLDNTRKNLRICTKSENQMNMNSNKNTTSKYKGIYWNKFSKSWLARIMLNQKSYNLGYFKCEEDAAIAYNKKAVEFFGEFAKLNEIEIRTD